MDVVLIGGPFDGTRMHVKDKVLALALPSRCRDVILPEGQTYDTVEYRLVMIGIKAGIYVYQDMQPEEAVAALVSHYAEYGGYGKEIREDAKKRIEHRIDGYWLALQRDEPNTDVTICGIKVEEIPRSLINRYFRYLLHKESRIGF